MGTTIGRDASTSGETALDRRLCEDIGAELARSREARGLSAADVGHALLLSIRQVRALEQVDFTAFHNASFYLGGLRKYARFVEIEPALLDRVTSSITPEPAAQAGHVSLGDPSEPVASSSQGLLRGLAVAVLLLAAGAGAYALWPRAGSAPGAAAPAARTSRPEPAATAAAAEPRLEPAVTGAGDTPPVATPAVTAPLAVAASSSEPTDAGVGPFGTVRVAKRTWVFVRSADGTEIERTLPDEGSMALESEPAYLAVGSPDAVLTISGRTIDAAPFVVNGQIRIRGADFDGLLTRELARPSR